MNPIQFDSVSKTYRSGLFRTSKTNALEDVSFSVPSSSVTAVLGANGAGKTTAIRCLLGLERPESGSIGVLEMDPIKDGLEIRQRVGYVAEKPALYEWMSVSEVGWFASGFYPTGFESEYKRWCERFHLPTDVKIKSLSKGMRSKVALSLSLAHKPELLILDEPTSGLDPLVRREFLESMIGVAAEGRTVLLCSHQVAEVERVADSVVVLINGRLVCADRLDDLKRSVTELVAVRPEGAVDPASPPGQILAHTPLGSDDAWLVRNADAEKIRAWENVVGPVQQRQPGLEDILLAMLREARRPDAVIRPAVVGEPSPDPSVKV